MINETMIVIPVLLGLLGLFFGYSMMEASMGKPYEERYEDI